MYNLKASINIYTKLVMEKYDENSIQNDTKIDVKADKIMVKLTT